MDRTHSFGYWLRRRRKALDLTQAELAQRVSCSLDLIQKIEADARRPSRQLAEKLAECLGIAADERAAFVQAARAERSVDRLALPSQPVEEPVVALPQGTITFLFTDIEGSSRLWEQHPRVMPAALARHDALMNEVLTAHSGVVFKTVGDSMLAAFAQAPSALAAALAAQRTISTEVWELPEPPRVRMALHTGSAEVRASDYFGPALNRAARLLSAGHGGQILLSLATEQLVREHLPLNTALRDLGMHRLKDLSLPEQIFQLVTSDLPATFPSPNTLDARHTNLPTQPTALLGREQDVAAFTTLLRRADVRLVTLTGPGGVGKTRLSLQVAAELIEDFVHGVFFVDLAPIREANLVTSAIATTLGVRESAGQPLLATLKDYLRDKRMLLLLDNFEQVVDAAPVVAELLAVSPQLKALVTSREVLHLRGEKEVPVTPLALPDPAHLPPLDQLSQYAAVALFIERALDARPDFVVTNANAPAVAEICAQLDGLPLAIELAAVGLKLFGPEALLVRLSSRLSVMTGGPRDLPVRQQTIRNTIAWSYELLTEGEQTLFRRLGVFVGGCTLEAAEAVSTLNVQTLERSNVVDGLAALLDKSLVRQTVDGDQPRFAMLETIREYALEQLEVSGEAELLRRQHALYYLALSEEGWPGRGPESRSTDDRTWVHHIDREYNNLRSALAWSQTSAGDPEVALRLAGVLTDLWYHRGVRGEGIALLERSLNHPLGVERTASHAQARVDLALLFGLTGDFAAARAQYEQALPLSRELGDTQLYAYILERLGWVAREQGDGATAWLRVTESLAIFRDLGDAAYTASTLVSMAGIAILEEDPARAEALLAESRAVAQQGDENPNTIFWRLNHLGQAAQLRGAYDRAAQFHQESLSLLETDTSPSAATLAAYRDLGETAVGLGRPDEAVRWLAQGLAASRMLGEQPFTAWCLASLGSAAALDQEPERAARLWGAAERLRQSIGCRPAPATRATYERALAATRARLGEEAFVAAWQRGRALTVEQAIAEALDEAAPSIT